MADERLLVYLDGQSVGVLTQNSAGRISFSYDDEYRNRPSAIPLSLSLPKRRADHPPKPVRAFISGLLPDSDRALARIASKYGVSPRNPFALLRHIGMDAAGAVQILPEEIPPSDAAVRQGDIEWLSSDDVETLLEDLAQSPESWDPGRDTGRWSLAGAQSKVALFRSSEGAWGIPRDSTPTTYILKPSIPDLSGHHLNEYLCLRRALSSCVESLGVGFGVVFGEVDADGSGGCGCSGAAPESLGVGCVVGLLCLVALVPAVAPGAVVDFVG
jgi:serine/threonine-protein kinase HipA